MKTTSVYKNYNKLNQHLVIHIFEVLIMTLNLINKAQVGIFFYYGVNSTSNRPFNWS